MRNPLTRLLLVGWVVTDQREVIAADVAQWSRRNHRDPGAVTVDLLDLASHHELRSVYYYRLTRGNAAGRWAARLLRRILPPAMQLDIATEEVGPGLFIRHGYGTILTAERIGANLWVHHGVTIGWDYVGRRPIIGDDVFIGTGAVIIGAITVGDGAVIGANAVVAKDVPAGATVLGGATRIIERKLEGGAP